MKRIILVIWFFVFFISVAAAQTDTVTVENLSGSGFGLDRSWKFHEGDDQRWASPETDDRNWHVISPSIPRGQLADLSKAKIGWFRLQFKLGKSFADNNVGFNITQSVASEIYIDGRLIRKYGQVSILNSQEKIYDPADEPLTVQLQAQRIHTLAVRYSIAKSSYFIGNRNDALDIVLTTPTGAWNNYKQHFENRNSQRSFVFGVFVVLGLVHLIIFFNYRSRKVNLYLALFAFATSFVFFDGFVNPLIHTLKAEVFVTGIIWFSAPIAYVFFLAMVYDLFDHKRTIWLKMLIAICVVIIPVEFLSNYGTSAIYLLAPTGTLIYLEITRIAIIAYRDQKKGSKIFLWGQSVALLFFCGLSYTPYIIRGLPYLVELVELDVAFLTPAVVMSFLLAREFAEKNINLEYQLKQVEELSQKTRVQEFEKQKLLTNQNILLERQVEERTIELSRSLDNLKATQTQLIQSEKMASLGELTAGIAHEIQNPLNFVNNFSEVSVELLTELKEEAEAGNTKDVVAIANDLTKNLEKINHHGKRADSIVKGMLEHSRVGTGEKQPTDLNALADEFLKLSYHGLRAKDKDFNAELITQFDEALPKANVSQQDIGRVLLNLFNNAFYAINEKKKTAPADYKPEVEVKTIAGDVMVEIKVKDNGNGIPDAIKDKIMQPFFTTKPTGEGTGLGLSLSYDIVVKGHGGIIKVISVEGEDSEFVIQLPIV